MAQKCLILQNKQSFSQYSKVILDVSLPAKKIYLKRGYKKIEFNSIAVGNQEFLCYDVMQKRFQMEKGRIVIITGSPGTGKTTAASVIAKESSLSRSVHIHTDDFYHYLSKGEIPLTYQNPMRRIRLSSKQCLVPLNLLPIMDMM